MKKKCPKCGIEKNHCDFSKDKRRTDGCQTRCKICKAEYDRNYYQITPNRRANKTAESRVRRHKLRSWLNEIKKGKQCSSCDEGHPACLDFHHNGNGKKEFSIGNAIALSFGKKRILEEIDKCVILCSNCHRKLHWKE